MGLHVGQLLRLGYLLVPHPELICVLCQCLWFPAICMAESTSRQGRRFACVTVLLVAVLFAHPLIIPYCLQLQYGDFRSTEIRRSILSALEQESRRSFVVPEQHSVVEASSPEETESDEHGNEKPQSRATASAVAALDFAKIVWNVTAQNTKAPLAHERIVMFLVVLWLTVISVITYGREVISLETRQLTVGIVVNLNLVFFYGAPLSTILTVVRTKNSASIHLPTLITNTLNGSFWCAFGIAVADWFIAVPNGLGALLGCTQTMLCVLFPRRPKREAAELVDHTLPQITNDVEMAATSDPTHIGNGNE
jgi:uncharacterized protein with PQ loop repeat